MRLSSRRPARGRLGLPRFASVPDRIPRGGVMMFPDLLGVLGWVLCACPSPPLDASDSAAKVLEEVIAQDGLAAATECFRELRAAEEGAFEFDEAEFNALGYRLLGAGDTAKALAVFAMNTELFPQSANAWDSLGEAYFTDRRLPEALRHYRRSLELNPESESARQMIARIDGLLSDAAAETDELPRFAPGAVTDRRGPWIGEEPVGNEPRVFAPGVISLPGQMEYAITFSPKGDELFFTRRAAGSGRGGNRIFVCRRTEAGWTAPAIAPFAGTHSDYDPHFVGSEDRLLFGSFRPLPGATSRTGEPALWLLDRAPDGWSEPRYFGAGTYVTSSRDGTTIVSTPEGCQRVLSDSLPYDRSKPEHGPPSFPRLGGHPCLAPDGSYVIFDAAPVDSRTDLFVCFRDANGAWGEAHALAEPLGMTGAKYCASVSPDGRYLFFSVNLDLYWVSTRILEGLRE